MSEKEKPTIRGGLESLENFKPSTPNKPKATLVDIGSLENKTEQKENELKFPGEIKVHVIRETRVIEYAR